MTTSLPCASSGTKGNGGAFITFAIVPSSSGDASDSAMNPAIVSAIETRNGRSNGYPMLRLSG